MSASASDAKALSEHVVTLSEGKVNSEEILKSLTLKGHSCSVNCVAISADGRRAISGAGRAAMLKRAHIGELFTWDLKGGLLERKLSVQLKPVFSVAISSDGNIAVSASHEKIVRVWDLNAGKCVQELKGHDNTVSCVAISSDGKRVVSGSYDKKVFVWNLKTGLPEYKLSGHFTGVNCVAITPDGNRVISGAKSLRVWDLTLTGLKTTFFGYCVQKLKIVNKYMGSVAISSDGKRAVSASNDGRVYIWDLITSTLSHELESKCASGFYPHRVAMTSDGSVVVASGRDHRSLVKGNSYSIVNVRDLIQNKTIEISLAQRLYFYTIAIQQVKNDVYALGGFGDTNIDFRYIYTLAIPAPTGAHISGESKIKRDLVAVKETDSKTAVDRAERVSSNRDYVAVVDNDHSKGQFTIHLLQVSTQKKISILKGHKDGIYHVAFNATGTQVLSGSGDSTVRLWDVESGKCLKSFEGKGNSKGVLNATGTQVLTTGSRCSLDDFCLWEVASQQCLKIFKGHSSFINCVAFNPTGTQVLSGGFDKTVRLWDVESGRCLKDFEGHTKQVECVVFNATGTQALSGSEDGTVRLWDIENWPLFKTPLKIFKGPNGITPASTRILHVAFNASGTQVLSANLGGTIQLWGVESGQCLKTFDVWVIEPSYVVFNATGTQVLSVGGKSICLWDVKSGESLRTILTNPGEGSLKIISPYIIPQQLLPSGLLPEEAIQVESRYAERRKAAKASGAGPEGGQAVAAAVSNTSVAIPVSPALVPVPTPLTAKSGVGPIPGVPAASAAAVSLQNEAKEPRERVEIAATGKDYVAQQLLPSGLLSEQAIQIASQYATERKRTAEAIKAGTGIAQAVPNAVAPLSMATVAVLPVPAHPLTPTPVASPLQSTAGPTAVAAVEKSPESAVLVTNSSDKARTPLEPVGVSVNTTATFSAAQIQFLKDLHGSGFQPMALALIQVQVERLNKQQSLLTQDHEASLVWLRILAEKSASIPSNAELKTLLEFANRIFQSDSKTKVEQDYIDSQPKLKAYQHRMQQELCRFITCYYLAPAGVFKLEDNKKDLIISAISGAPIAGYFLKPLTAILSFANKKIVFYK